MRKRNHNKQTNKINKTPSNSGRRVFSGNSRFLKAKKNKKKKSFSNNREIGIRNLPIMSLVPMSKKHVEWETSFLRIWVTDLFSFSELIGHSLSLCSSLASPRRGFGSFKGIEERALFFFFFESETISVFFFFLLSNYLFLRKLIRLTGPGFYRKALYRDWTGHEEVLNRYVVFSLKKKKNSVVWKLF